MPATVSSITEEEAKPGQASPKGSHKAQVPGSQNYGQGAPRSYLFILVTGTCSLECVAFYCDYDYITGTLLLLLHYLLCTTYTDTLYCL